MRALCLPRAATAKESYVSDMHKTRLEAVFRTQAKLIEEKEVKW